MYLACSTRTMANARMLVREPEARQWTVYPRRGPQAAPVPPARLTPAQRPILTPADEVRRIIDLVARMHGCTYLEVVGRKRSVRISLARFAAIGAVRQARPDYSTPQLGRYFNRDHTSILNSLRVWRTGKVKPVYGRARRA